MDLFQLARPALALCILIAPTIAEAQTQTQAQTPPPIRITESVVVTPDDAAGIAAAINRLRRSRDPLVAQTVADNLVALTDAMSSSGRVFHVGPLTEAEQEVVDLPAALRKYSVEGGSIRLQPRGQESTEGPVVYSLTRSSFIKLCADLASTGSAFRVTQEIKMIVVARMIADLSEQQEQVMPEREVLEGVLKGFKGHDRQGVVIGRVLAIADALATDADQQPAYDLVPVARLMDFRDIGHMDTGVFAVVARPVANAVNVRNGGLMYSTSVNHFVWFFLRFLLADPNDLDDTIREKRKALGSDLLDYLTTQLEVRALQSTITLLEHAPVGDTQALALGDYVLGGPLLDTLKNAPGVSEQRSAHGAGYRTLVMLAKDNSKRPALREWLARELAKRTLLHDPFVHRVGRARFAGGGGARVRHVDRVVVG
jgi:hypothetical protein